MKKILTLLLLLNFTVLHAQDPTFTWAKSFGGSSSDQAKSVTTDATGNVYTTGYFTGTTDFDPGAGTMNLTSAGSVDVFVSKVDAAGNFVWARTFGSTTNDVGNSIAIDAAGNVLIFGNFNGTVDFDPGAATVNQTAIGQDIFVLKLDATGNFVWVKTTGGALSETAAAMAIDVAGNIYTTGAFAGTSDFDPGAGTANLTSAGSFDVYILKLDASGNFGWAKSIGGSLDDVGRSIKIDALGNVYSNGTFRSTVDFDPGAGVSNMTALGIYDTYVIKMDPLGNLTWAKSFGGVGSAVDAFSIAVDVAGNVLTTGSFPLTADFDPGAGTSSLTSAGSRDVFVSKLDAAGNFVWATKVGNAGSDEGNTISVDAAGNVYTAGYFNNTVDFDPGAGTVNLISAGAGDIFLLKLNSSGSYASAFRIGGIAYDRALASFVDGAFSIFLGGYFGSVADFDPGAGTTNLTSTAFDDVFVAKFGQVAPLPLQLVSFTGMKCDNNICLEWQTEGEIAVAHFEIERSRDGRTFEKAATRSATNSPRAKYSFQDNGPFNVTVFYRLKMVDRNGAVTYSRVININAGTRPIVKLGPNPIRNILNIYNAQKITDIQVYDLKGNLVRRFSGNASNRYPLVDLKASTYIIKVVEENGTSSTHTIVKE